MCMQNKCERHAAFLPEDWRDMVMLEHEYADMPVQDRHRQAELENKHIVEVYASNKEDRARRQEYETRVEYRKRQILARIKKDGGIDGMKLISRAE